MQLIELAKTAGIAVGRNKSKRYRWARFEGGRHVEHEFLGTWNQFVAHVRKIVAETAR